MRPAIEPSPQANTGTRPEFEVAVERQFDSVGSGDDWRFLEPNTMLYAAQIQHSVPTIGALPKLTFVQLVQIQPDGGMRADERCGAHRHNRRQGLGSPEDCLFEERSVGISCEKPTPSAAGFGRSKFDLMMRSSDNLVQTTRCGAGIPTQFRSTPLLRCGRSRYRLTISS